MSKPIIITLLIIIAIIIIALVLLSINYFNCLSDEGKRCGSSGSIQVADVERVGALKYKCSFFKGKTCEI